MNKMKLALPGIAILVFYLISIVLSPLFHLHPEEHHAESEYHIYHSHAEQFDEHSDDDHREDKSNNHFSETIALLHDLIGIAQINPRTIINPLKFSPISGVLIPPISSENCTNQFSRKSILSLPARSQPQQDYSVLSATNLSPPQA